MNESSTDMSPGDAPSPQTLRYLRWMLLFYWLALFASTHWPKFDVRVADGRSLGDVNLDKPLHFVAYAILTALVLAAHLRGRYVTWLTNIINTALLVSIFSVFDEMTQPLANRTASWNDIAANETGMVGILLAAMVQRMHGPRKLNAMILARMALALIIPLLLLMTLVPQFRLDDVMVMQSQSDWSLLRLDRLAHLVGSFGLTLLLFLAKPLGESRPKLGWIVTVLFMAVVGPSVEYVQHELGRGFEEQDIFAHNVGLVLAIIVGCFLLVAGWLIRPRPHRVLSQQIDASDAMHAEADALESESDESKSSAIERPGTGKKPSRFIGHAMTVSVLTLLSRVTGLVREAVLAGAFGRGPIADAFVFGFQVPNLFRRLFGEGALSAAFIPVYAKQLQQDREIARRLASVCMALMLIVLGSLTLVGELILAAVLYAKPWHADTSLAIRLTMVMLPYMPLVCLVAMLGAVLQVHGSFGPTAAAPILLNVVVIAGTLFATHNATDPETLRHAVFIVAASVLIAGVAQLIWQIVAAARHEKFALQFAGTRTALRSLLAIFIPMAIGLAAFQINTFMDNVIALSLRAPDNGAASFILMGYEIAYPMQRGDVAALAWAQRLYEFPLGIFGIAIATAIFPALARAGSDPYDPGLFEFRTIMQHGLRLTMFIGLPASIGLIAIRLPLVRVIFERGEFTLDDSVAVAWILAGYAPAIWAYSMNHVLTRAFYALHDTRTPLAISLVMIVLNLVLNLTFVWPFGAMGFALSTAFCAVLQCVLMLLAIRNYIDSPVDRHVWLSWIRTIGLSLLMAAAVFMLADLIPADRAATSMLVTSLVITLVGGLLVFLGGAWALDMEETSWLLRRRSKE